MQKKAKKMQTVQRLQYVPKAQHTKQRNCNNINNMQMRHGHRTPFFQLHLPVLA
jgi:hypothetical protein